MLASTMGVYRAYREYPMLISRQLLIKASLGMIALLLGNAYIVGINQIYDFEVDKINKPQLPIASEKLSIPRAWCIVTCSLISSVILVKSFFSSVIWKLYLLGIVLGTLYSVPPFQWKRHPLVASGIIAVVRGLLLNFGVYYGTREALNIPFRWNPVVIFISAFMTVFAMVIAITKVGVTIKSLLSFIIWK